MEQFEIVVVGGGMVGAAVAIGFAKQGRTVAVVEKFEPKPFDLSQPMDLRVSAISPHSIELLEALGAWDDIAAMRICPYARLETWEAESCRLRFNADTLGAEQLGYIVENRVIQLGLWAQFSHYENLTVIDSDGVANIALDPQGNTLTLESGRQLQTLFVVGADGANSKVRQAAGIGVTAWDYRQECMLINVETELPQQDITWQWFTPSGPRSFLPLCGHQGSLVWYDAPKRIKQLKAMTFKQLENEIQHSFPAELGQVRVLAHGSFPLTRRHAQQYSKHRCILVGDAAHTINPLAGQGVNLGFKDVSSLLQLSSDNASIEGILRRYEVHRRPDNLLMQTGMDVFYKGFSNTLSPVQVARNAILKLAEHSGPIKTQILRYAMGLK
ncbi:2-octaprenyl-3-methyl-6-methoxy-1,4-benzoquinol hydroxylase [Vibrio methylphosphonaticus]|uniref:2-octaprenyl-3-methyl-6-methoxy-1,4-benzoquinol hydroxylase n=1 Tax=Vibrio methylphosphonaticus TaxID=2946866 RepID=UPI00202A63D8|nr:2-octaprenyl-3-methyl-6-methoxy-1,4-benzoquinol hydroxylase [Vibrio methylphosphonaticus]MCL9776173.1 2-octaprenyl-3-methyl-6-methoxy-1,4-benzoquinol hydroxylase [Vibrio methylphosphonaticus]